MKIQRDIENHMMYQHNRRSIRLKGYDYSQPGAYFVTICTHNRACLFGDIINGQMILNNYGEIVDNEWIKTAEIRKNIILDEFIVMPNHVHGIIIIDNDAYCRVTVHHDPTINRAPTQYECFGKPTSNTIPTIIRSLKSTITKQINIIRNTPNVPVWQRNYYEHVIRNENELNRIRQYIIDNPVKWENDHDFEFDESQIIDIIEGNSNGK